MMRWLAVGLLALWLGGLPVVWHLGYRRSAAAETAAREAEARAVWGVE